MENEAFYYRLGDCQFEETLRLPVTKQKEENEDDARYRTLRRRTSERERARCGWKKNDKISQSVLCVCVYICRTSSECYKKELERPLYVCVRVYFIIIIFR